jgi:hypothetical protein
MDVPIRSLASNFSLILALPFDEQSFQEALVFLTQLMPDQLNSVLILWPAAHRPSGLASIIDQLPAKVTIRFLNWEPDQMVQRFSSFVDSIIYRTDTSKECWLFVDLREMKRNKIKMTANRIKQAFAAWKENADSILSFDPYAEPSFTEKVGGPASILVENWKQAPFYHGAAFIHPVGLSFLCGLNFLFSMQQRT